MIEKHFGTKRREIPKPIVPARYILSSIKTAIADCAKFQSTNKINETEQTEGGKYGHKFLLYNLLSSLFAFVAETEQSIAIAFDIWRTKRNKRTKATSLLRRSHTILKKKTNGPIKTNR